MSRIARQGASLLALLFALIPLGMGVFWLATRTSAAGPTTDLRTALLRAGLGSEALAAAGVSAQETVSIVGTFASAMASAPGALEQADLQYATARTSKDQLERKVRSGLATQQEVAALAVAKAALSSAAAAREDLLAGWFEDASANLALSKVTALSAIHANSAWKLPVEFLVDQRDQIEWVALRDALANERICAKYGDPPDQAQQTALAGWRAEAAVAAAKSALDANLAGVKSAWSSATGI